MTNENFTQGEWEIEEKEMGCGTLFRYGFQVVCWEKRRRIAYMETCSLGDKEEMQANAAILKTAPKMYRKLETVLALCEGNLLRKTRCDILGQEIRELLREARGEE